MAADDGMLAPAPRRSACGERRRAKASGAIVLLGSLLLYRATVGARAGAERWLALLASLSGLGGVAIALLLLGEAGLAGMSGIVGAAGLALGLLLRPAKAD